MVRPCVQNVLGTIGEAASPVVYSHGKDAQIQVEWLHFRPWLVRSWCGASRSYLRLLFTIRYCESPRVACPTTLPLRKRRFQTGGIQPVKLGGVISAIFGSQVDTSWKCCDKTMDDRMALNREWCFPNCKISRWKVSFVGFRGVIAPIAPLGSGPGMKMN